MQTHTQPDVTERIRAMERNNEILAAVRRGIEKVKHYQKFNKRVINAIRAELPGYTVSDSSNAVLQTIAIWGKDVEYDHRILMCWNTDMDWRDGIEKELQRCCLADYIERLRQEQALYAQFAEMNSQIQSLRKKAKQLLNGLPVPKSATLRKDPSFWSGATSETEKLFPLLLGSVKEI